MRYGKEYSQFYWGRLLLVFSMACSLCLPESVTHSYSLLPSTTPPRPVLNRKSSGMVRMIGADTLQSLTRLPLQQRVLMELHGGFSPGKKELGSSWQHLKVPTDNAHTTTSLSSSPSSMEDILYNPPKYLLDLLTNDSVVASSSADPMPESVPIFSSVGGSSSQARHATPTATKKAPSLFPLSATSTETRTFSVADIATLSGKSLARTQRDLSALALATGGRLQVRETDGELFYTFPRNLPTVLRRRSWNYRVRSVWQEYLSPTLTQAYRLSFGVTLFLSLGLIFLVLTSSVSQRPRKDSEKDKDKDRKRREYQGRYADRDWDYDDDWHFRHGKIPLGGRRRNRWGGSGSGVQFVIDIGDIFRVIHRIVTYRSSTPTTIPASAAFDTLSNNNNQIENEVGLLKYFEGFFEFLFGLDNPNDDLEDTLYKTIANVIRRNKGRIVADQIIHLLPSPPPIPSKGSTHHTDRHGNIDESWMLPVLMKFHGQPKVNSAGQIIYHFPDMMVSGDQYEGEQSTVYEKDTFVPKEKRFDTADLVLEQKQQFSKSSSTMPIILGVVNAIGIFYVQQFATLNNLHNHPVLKFLPFLIFYAIGYLWIPLLRWFSIKLENQKIDERNELRVQWYQRLHKRKDDIAKHFNS